MLNQIPNKAFDPVAERTLINSIFHFGSDAFYDISAWVNENDFFNNENKLIFSILKKLITQDNIEKPDIATVFASAGPNLGYDVKDYILNITTDVVQKDSQEVFAKKVKKLSLIRNLQHKLYNTALNLNNFTGEESLLEIVSKAEQPFNEFTTTLVTTEDTVELNNFVENYLTFLNKEKPTHQGIPTGFPLLDLSLGGGLRKPGVHLLGGRTGVGKSWMLLKIGQNVCSQEIPVLYIDTELTKEIVTTRLVSMFTNEEMRNIETGQFDLTNENFKNKLENFKNSKFSYENISGKHHTEWLSTIRRWLMKKVGFGSDGKVKDCLIILDYIKLMDITQIGNNQEYQYLGQVIIDLHNFAIKYNLAILSGVQLNRDGITKEDQSIMAGSDRLLTNCSSFFILKNKEPQDFAADPPENGNKKWINIKTRFGTGLETGEYINIKTELSRGVFDEGCSNLLNQSNGVMAVARRRTNKHDDSIPI